MGFRELFNYSALYYARLVSWCVGYGHGGGIVDIASRIMTKQVIDRFHAKLFITFGTLFPNAF